MGDSWIDRTEWKRRDLRFYREVSMADAIKHLQRFQGQEADDLKLGVICSVTVWEPKTVLAQQERSS